MRTGSIPLADLPGGFDLQSTVESGQTFRWEREGPDPETDRAHGSDAWYATVFDGEVVRARRSADALEWESTTDAEPVLRARLRLDEDLAAVREGASDDPIVRAAYERYPGMRLVDDPFFDCLVSFVCSAQMRVERIREMQATLRARYGEPIEADGRTYHAFPTPAALAAAGETELRECGLGYRAPYVARTAEMVASGEWTAADVRADDLETTRERLCEFVGVGEKVADCVALFSLGHLEAVPLDTWIRRAVREHFPACARDDYASTSRAIREAFGPLAGYTQTYVFHYLRHAE